MVGEEVHAPISHGHLCDFSIMLKFSLNRLVFFLQQVENGSRYISADLDKNQDNILILQFYFYGCYAWITVIIGHRNIEKADLSTH